MVRKKLVERINDRDITFKALGGVSEVGATSYFIKWKGSRILIDAGKRTSNKFATPEYDEIGRDIDILFITHVHRDHIGSLMEYFDYFKIKTIIATPETIDSLSPVLLDSYKIFKKNVFDIDNPTLSESKFLDLYSEKNIDKLIKSIKPVNYNTQNLYLNFKYTLLNTSHLIGSCGIILEDHSYRLFVTSDYTESQKFFHPRTSFEAAYDSKIDTMITETTYGSDEEGDEILKESTLSDLESKINKIFNGSGSDKKGGNILIPSFAIGRTQEIILALLLLIKQNRIPFTTKIRVPFNLNKYSQILAEAFTMRYYEKYKYILEEELGEKINLDFPSFIRQYLSPINLYEDNDFLKSENQILIGTPGMLGNYVELRDDKDYEIVGIIRVALDIFSSERHGIIFAGFQANNTLGNKIQQSAFGSSFIFRGQSFVRKTPHIYKVTFPGHVSAKGIINLTKKIEPDNIILTHGDLKSSITIAKTIKDRKIDVIVPDIEEVIYLLDNGKKCFFSSHHKESNLILSMDPLEISFNYNTPIKTTILKEKEFADLKLIIAVKDVIKSDRTINHIDFLINSKEENILFYKKLQNELIDLGVSSDLISVDISLEDNLFLFYDLLELVSEKALEFKEKFSIYLIYQSFLYSYPFFIISQILNQKIYFINEDNTVESLPLLPIDLDIRSITEANRLISKSVNNNDIFIEGKHFDKTFYTDFYELLDRISKYKGKYKLDNRAFLADRTPNQLPRYNKMSILFRKDIFSSSNKSLWGDIESIYDIKNNVAVKIIQYLTDTLNEDILEIKFTNYIYNYDSHRYYGELIGSNKDTLFYKLVLENGIQFLLIKLAFKVNVEKAIQKIGNKYEC